MKFQIPPMASDVIICIYALVSLFLRFKLESEHPVSPVESIVMGVCFVVILYVFIKLKVLNPNWFGLIGPKKVSQ